MILIGQGVDVHPFDSSRDLILGGVYIPCAAGLAGHSDADAVLHALTDALLGAVGAGDIGEYFPSTDDRWKNAESKAFVAEALRLVRERDGEVGNVDITIVAQKPKLAPHKEAIRESVASMIGIPSGRVNIKATTTDHLGFIGREEGLCALAIATVIIGRASINEG
jgi:2-C-methyl-D-erythritol 4-phosphate cytidylyltransferase/2-C-methyl-D-erythritol 2,4-cyclodiphosphate synthase